MDNLFYSRNEEDEDVENVRKINLDELEGQIQAVIIDKIEKWHTTYYKLIEYFNIYNKRPFEKSKDIEEKRLGQWISIQQRNYLKNKFAMGDTDKRILWEQLKTTYQSYFISNDDKWMLNYNELIKYF